MLNDLSISNCPLCWGKVRLIIEKPYYGPDNVLFECERCGNSMQGTMWSEDGFRNAESIGRGILALSEQWNAHAREIRNQRKIPFQRYKCGIQNV